MEYNKIPTRKEISEMLEKYLENELEFSKLHNYGDEYFFCDEEDLEIKDNLILNILTDFVSRPIIEKYYPNTELYKRFIRILNCTNSEIEEEVEFILAYENNKKGFAYKLSDLAKGKKEEFEKYLSDKFDLGIKNFPFQEIINLANQDPEENIKLIENTLQKNKS